jgi:hypothetical protein
MAGWQPGLPRLDGRERVPRVTGIARRVTEDRALFLERLDLGVRLETHLVASAAPFIPSTSAIGSGESSASGFFEAQERVALQNCATCVCTVGARSP